MKVFVTGGSGYIGSVVVRRLLERGDEVVVFDNLERGHPIPVKLSPRRPGDPPALYASGEKARRELGWNPTHSGIDTIIRDAWTFHKTHPEGVSDGLVQSERVSLRLQSKVLPSRC